MTKKKTEAKKVGRPRKERDPKAAQMVKTMASRLIPQDDICVALKEAGFEYMNKNTLEREYREDLDAGYALGRSKLRQTAMDVAINEKDRSVLIFLLKSVCGLREHSSVEMTSPDGSMSPKAGTSINFSGMTPEEITNIARAAFTGE